MTEKASHILMIQPQAFGFNDQTSSSNSFQKKEEVTNSEEIQQKALNEFNSFVEKLTSNGISVTTFTDSLNPHTPDSIYPNNWISFHENGQMVIYPMLAENRRKERRLDIISHFQKVYTNLIDLSNNEEQEIYLEGTGSIVFDYQNKIAYANASPRTNIDLLKKLCTQINYECISFKAVDEKGNDIYHTNVLMCIGKTFAVLCSECIPNKNELMEIKLSLSKANLEVIEINYAQLNSFAGNMYELENKEGKSCIVMSEQALKSLDTEQINKLAKHGSILHSPLYTIEQYGGGSARCMIADVR